MDTHVHHDTRVDADYQPEPCPAAGPEAMEGIPKGYVNPSSGYTNPENHTVTTSGCTASPYGVPDTDARQRYGR